MIEDLYNVLVPYDIDLYLCYIGDGPYLDPVAGARFGFLEPRRDVSVEFVQKWSEVASEYSICYGRKVNGWWVDGCYSFFGYDEIRLKILADAMREGNPARVIALNRGVESRVMAYSASDDFTSGEMTDFIDLPDSRFINNKQWHILAPLGLPPCNEEGVLGRMDDAIHIEKRSGI